MRPFAVTCAILISYVLILLSQDVVFAQEKIPTVLVLYYSPMQSAAAKKNFSNILTPIPSQVPSQSQRDDVSSSTVSQGVVKQIEVEPLESVLLTNYLGHFDAKVSRIPADRYFSGLMKNYDFVFYLGWAPTLPVPKSFIDDIPKYPNIGVVWIRHNIEKLLEAHPNIYGFKVGPIRDGFESIFYNETIHPRKDVEQVATVEVTGWDKTVSYGHLISRRGITPFCLNSKNLWFFPDLTFYDVNALVFADLLHDVLNTPHVIDHRFFVRIEDIHALRDPSKIRRLSLELYKKKVPFLLAVIPRYTRPGKNERVMLKERPHLVKALKDSMSMGGSILMHGYTHQWKNESGEGHEFWDVLRDREIDEYTEAVVREKMENGIKELVDLELYPIAWETPHYAASAKSYRTFAQYFSMAVERRQISEKSYLATEEFPFIIEDIYGQTIVPENLGYINMEEGETPEKILAKAAKFKIVRDAVVGFFYHPYYEPKYMMQAVEGLQKLGFDPLDLREIPGTVQTKDITIYSGLSTGGNFKSSSTMTPLDAGSRVIKVDMKDVWLNTMLLDAGYNVIQEKWFKEISEGEALIEIPYAKDCLFIIRLLNERPGPISRFGKFVSTFILGKTSTRIETIQRWIVWSFFIITTVFVVIVIRVYVTRISYHKSHYRKKKKPVHD